MTPTPESDAPSQPSAAIIELLTALNDDVAKYGLEVVMRRRGDTAPDALRESSGQWLHCTPALITAGVDCTRTPRRDCACPVGGSHDHWIAWSALTPASAPGTGEPTRDAPIYPCVKCGEMRTKFQGMVCIGCWPP